MLSDAQQLAMALLGFRENPTSGGMCSRCPTRPSRTGWGRVSWVKITDEYRDPLGGQVLTLKDARCDHHALELLNE